MEHPCSKCGAVVEDGVPFCRHCRAPQIRVLVEAPPVPLPARDIGRTPSPAEAGFAPAAAFSKAGIQWSRALPMAALGGVLSVLLLLLPLGAYGLASLAGGAAAVVLYERRSAGAHLSPSMGAKVGAASGGFGFLFLAITLVATWAYRADELRKLFEDKVAELIARGYNPQQAKAALDLLRTPEGLAFFLAAFLMMLAFIFVAASAIGGALGARLLDRRRPR